VYSKIMVPVDLAHAGRLDKALQTAADLANHYNAEAVYVGVTATTPSTVAHTPQEFKAKLNSFAADEAGKHGHKASGHMIIANDPTIDVDNALMRAVGEIGADLVVMASHVPNLADYVWPSNGGQVASHSKASVFIVRAG